MAENMELNQPLDKYKKMTGKDFQIPDQKGE